MEAPPALLVAGLLPGGGVVVFFVLNADITEFMVLFRLLQNSYDVDE